MDLGTFSVSLAVKDIKASRRFYEALGFDVTDGAFKSKEYPPTDHHDWLIMENGSIKIGLFMGMFEENVLTFNPEDVRAIQRKLKQSRVELSSEADLGGTGPACITLKDPDGNSILIDQH